LDDFYQIERENSFFCFNIPPLVGTQIINCTAQGRVTRQTKERKSDTQQVTNRVLGSTLFNKLKSLYGTLYNTGK
jgi:hypothetical protein